MTHIKTGVGLGTDVEQQMVNRIDVLLIFDRVNQESYHLRSNRNFLNFWPNDKQPRFPMVCDEAIIVLEAAKN